MRDGMMKVELCGVSDEQIIQKVVCNTISRSSTITNIPKYNIYGLRPLLLTVNASAIMGIMEVRIFIQYANKIINNQNIISICVICLYLNQSREMDAASMWPHP